MFYKKEVNKRKLFKEDSSDIKEFNYIKTASTESYIIQKSLHKIMLDYYTQTKYFFKLYNRDTYIYHLDNIIVYAYKYDNTPNIALKSGKLTLTWEDRDFWAKIFDPNIDYIEGNDFNYFIDSEEKTELYRLLALNFQSTPVIKKEGINYIYAPINHIEEAIYKTLTKNNTIPLDQKIKNQMILYGFNFENIKEKLLTTDGSFYFKDPTIIDELEVENLEEHHYLNLLKSKKDKNSLNRSIASIISHSKKNPKKVLEEKKVKKYPEKKLKYRNYDNIRLPYKDN
ncbi:MAG: hypothetical protein PHF21_04185, partial [Bacilli bacterium]|nr:hypothetical protein [Bacilli bacterium]